MSHTLNYINRRRRLTRYVIHLINRLRRIHYFIDTITSRRLIPTGDTTPPTYRETRTRQEIIRLQSIPWSEYYQSEHWRRVKERALAYYGHKCAMDVEHDNSELHCHHRDYSRKGCERPEDVLILCRGCHQKHHFLQL